jgi:N-acetylmuramic acid 6-phosphate (MurNAc-6-P) etherase
MMNEETYLKENVGTRNPFQVPDGYFEQLTQQVMQQLPERQQHRSRLVALRPWLYAAACVVALFVLGTTYHFNTAAEEPAALAATTIATADNNDAEFDAAADYAMIDNVDIYACLTDN